MSKAMNAFPGLPDEVLDVMRNSMFTEFATLTAKGVPIDTPLFCFTDLAARSLDVATGLAYPAKAERARRNPKVGLLLESGPDQPVISIAGLAAVKDADIQANADRYIAETIAYFEAYSGGNPWSVARNAVWYWSRIFICTTPKRILWWRSPAHMDSAPQRWDAPASFEYPSSDPAPAGRPTPPAPWPIREWRTRAQELLEQKISAHLTLIDAEGFPLPLRTRSAVLMDGGFKLEISAGAPWQVQGKASLCFMGAATFIGDVEPVAGGARFVVERLMPDLPTVLDPGEIWKPSPSTRTALVGRLEEELARRGRPVPVIPQDPPAPTEGSIARAKIMARIMQEMALREAAT